MNRIHLGFFQLIAMSYQTDDQQHVLRTQPQSLMTNQTDENVLGVHAKMATLTVEDFIYRARLAEKALRYEDMLIQMRHVLDLKKKLSADERNLLVVAYKNAVTTRRTGVCVCMCVCLIVSLDCILFLFSS